MRAASPAAKRPRRDWDEANGEPIEVPVRPPPPTAADDWASPCGNPAAATAATTVAHWVCGSCAQPPTPPAFDPTARMPRRWLTGSDQAQAANTWLGVSSAL